MTQGQAVGGLLVVHLGNPQANPTNFLHLLYSLSFACTSRPNKHKQPEGWSYTSEGWSHASLRTSHKNWESSPEARSRRIRRARTSLVTPDDNSSATVTRTTMLASGTKVAKSLHGAP